MLKNLFLGAVTALLVAFSGTAFAQNWYVQGDVGASKLEEKSTGITIKDDNTAFRASVGKDFGKLRYAVDYTHFGKVEDNTTTYNSETKVQSLGLSALYDFDLKTAFTPYVGARVGLNRVEMDFANTSGSYTANESKTQFGIGALAGVQYSLTPALALNANVEYNYLGKLDLFDTEVNQYGVNVGLRYNF